MKMKRNKSRRKKMWSNIYNEKGGFISTTFICVA